MITISLSQDLVYLEGLVFGAVTQYLIQVFRAEGVFSHPHSPLPLKGLSVPSCWAKVRAGSLPLTGAGPPQLGMGMPGAAGQC